MPHKPCYTHRTNSILCQRLERLAHLTQCRHYVSSVSAQHQQKKLIIFFHVLLLQEPPPKLIFSQWDMVRLWRSAAQVPNSDCNIASA